MAIDSTETLDDEEFFDESTEVQNDTTTTTDTPSSQEEGNTDFITELLKDRGIEDKSKIQFEEDGVIKNLNWDDLSDSDKLNIIRTSSPVQRSDSDDLDQDELSMINQIRQSGMTPQEYIDYMQKQAVDDYQNSNTTPQYSVDQYDDDSLFMADFMSRIQGATQEEAQEALEQAKSNEDLWKRQIESLRNQYKTIEDETLMQQQTQADQEAQERYNQFTDQVVDEINNLTSYSGYDLNLQDDDMQEIYDFITSTDAAGNNYFAKALADPKILVKAAWLTLHGEDMLNDITEYYQKAISAARQDGYEKGLKDQNKRSSDIVYQPKSPAKGAAVYDDLDEF